MVGCATSPTSSLTAQDAASPRGPWAEVPALEMPTGDASIPIALLWDVADALLKLPGAKVCDPVSKKPIVGLSTEYCATVYVAGTQDALSWRVSEPVAGSHRSCTPFFSVDDADYPPSRVWVVGYVHNHPCASALSSRDLAAWPTDGIRPFAAMAELRLVPANPVPAVYKSTAIEMASAIVAERQDGTRIFLRYFPTGEIQQWSKAKEHWVTLGTCAPAASSLFHQTAPQCREGSIQLLRE
jgi:hypothetical protein